jgi:uncharacterized protein (TIGR00369 family)
MSMMAEEVYPWQEPVRGGYPDPRSFGLSGLESLRAALSGHGFIIPPISRLTGMLLREVDEGYAVFEMPATGWFLSSQNQISVGALMMLSDGSFGCSVLTALPAATPYTTSELSMSFLKPCAAEGTVRSIGRLLHVGDPLALSDVWVEDARGERVAHGTSTLVVLPTIDGVEPITPEDLPMVEQPTYPTPDPYEREPVGATIPWDEWRTMPGVEILRRQIKGELPQPPIHYLTGLTLREVGEGFALFTLPATEWLTSPLRTVQGGAVAMLAHAALATAVTTTLEAGSAYRPVDVKVNFLRPVFADGKDIEARGTVTHRGRTLAVANAEVIGTDGKKVATATGSTIILPERGD